MDTFPADPKEFMNLHAKTHVGDDVPGKCPLDDSAVGRARSTTGVRKSHGSVSTAALVSHGAASSPSSAMMTDNGSLGFVFGAAHARHGNSSAVTPCASDLILGWRTSRG